MKKTVVAFKRTDGPKPSRVGASQAFGFRSPIPFTLPAGVEVKISLGLECTHPVHMFPARGLLERGVELVDGVWAIQDANQELHVKLKNTSKETISFDIGELLAKGVVIDNSFIDVKEE